MSRSSQPHPEPSPTATLVLRVPELPQHHDPRNWSTLRRWYIALVIWNLIVPIDMSSTIYVRALSYPPYLSLACSVVLGLMHELHSQSGGQSQIQAQFHVSDFVVTLGVGLVNLGIAIGPLIGAPLSEMHGRQPMYLVSAASFTAFSLGCTLSPSMTSLLVFRLLTGLFSSAVFSNFGGSLSDMFTPDERGPLVALFTLVLQGAPTIGPVPGSWMGQLVSWRWIMGLMTIWGAAVGVLVLFLPETQPGKIARVLKRKEERERRSCEKDAEKGAALGGLKDPGYPPEMKDLWGKALLTPLAMLCFEPIVLCTSIYHAFIYGLLFILLEGYPYIYKNTYNLTLGQTGLTFISPWIGNLLGVAVYFGYFKHSYTSAQHALVAQNAALPFPHPFPKLRPEARLPGVILASVLVPVGMVWFAFSSASPHTHIIVPLLSGVPVGMGMTLLQLSLSNYYIDLYPTLSASALAANLFVRNMVATWFPTFAIPMYERLGGRNASLVLAGIACAGVPAGVVLLVWGRRLRGFSERALKHDYEMWDGERGVYLDHRERERKSNGEREGVDVDGGVEKDSGIPAILSELRYER